MKMFAYLVCILGVVPAWASSGFLPVTGRYLVLSANCQNHSEIIHPISCSDEIGKYMAVRLFNVDDVEFSIETGTGGTLRTLRLPGRDAVEPGFWRVVKFTQTGDILEFDLEAKDGSTYSGARVVFTRSRPFPNIEHLKVEWTKWVGRPVVSYDTRTMDLVKQ